MILVTGGAGFIGSDLVTTDNWLAKHDRSLRWNDPELASEWGLNAPPVLAPQDAFAPLLADAEVFE